MIPERIIFVSRGTTVQTAFEAILLTSSGTPIPNFLCEAKSFLKSSFFFRLLKKLLRFMESEVEVPSSQETATCGYPEPDETSLRSPLYFQIHFNIILPFKSEIFKCFMFFMQQANFIYVFLDRHVSGTYAHHQEH